MDKKIQIDPPATGAVNMQKDRHNFEKAASFNESEYLVRIYEWQGPVISLGVAQKDDIFKKEALQKHNIEVVSRVTGGRAVLHYNEITYSVAASVNSKYFGGSLYDTYKKISCVLLDFFRSINLNANINQSRQQENYIAGNPVCFDSTSLYEIELNGNKLCGSAQKRNEKAFLQHGSIPVFTRQSEILQYFNKHKPLKNSNFVCLADYIKEPDMAVLKKGLYNAFNEFVIEK